MMMKMRSGFLLLGLLAATTTTAFHITTSPIITARPSSLSSPIIKQTSSSSSSSSSLSANVVDIQEQAPRDIQTFQEWAINEVGVLCAEGVQLAPNTPENGGEGDDWLAVTTQDIPAQTGVLQVPAGMIWSSTGARQELLEMPGGGGQSVQEAANFLGRLGAQDQVPQLHLVVKLLVEWQRGDESPWFPWLNALPRLFFNSVSMTNACYECLPPLVFSLARIERIKFDNFYQALQKIDNSLLSEETKADQDLAKWAFNVVYTRCWSPDPDDPSVTERLIVPMADMLNHGTETEVAISYDEEGNCLVYSTKDIPAGSPLRMSYGCPTNPSQLFATYGFLDETSPATFCKIMRIQPTPELKDLGLDFSRMLFYKDSGEVSQEVWDVLLYDYLSTADKDTQRAFYEAHMSGDLETKESIHEYYRLETASALKDHVDTFLKSLDELSAKAATKDVNEHPRVPLILRHNDFVKKTFLTVKARLDPMVAAVQEAELVA